MNTNMSGKWIGEYTYGDSYPENVRGQSINFYLDCTDIEGSISGTFTDDETKDIFNEPGTFNGFIEDHFVSFIKRYPCYYYSDEEGNIQLVENIQSQEIHYTGDVKDGLFEGVWEMTVAFKFEDGHVEHHDFDGTWSMFKS